MLDFLQAISRAIKKKHTIESIKRSEICAACPEKKKAMYAELVNAKIEEVQGYVCLRCSCPIASKVFAQDKENICDKWK